MEKNNPVVVFEADPPGAETSTRHPSPATLKSSKWLLFTSLPTVHSLLREPPLMLSV